MLIIPVPEAVSALPGFTEDVVQKVRLRLGDGPITFTAQELNCGRTHVLIAGFNAHNDGVCAVSLNLTATSQKRAAFRCRLIVNLLQRALMQVACQH